MLESVFGQRKHEHKGYKKKGTVTHKTLKKKKPRQVRRPTEDIHIRETFIHQHVRHGRAWDGIRIARFMRDKMEAFGQLDCGYILYKTSEKKIDRVYDGGTAMSIY